MLEKIVLVTAGGHVPSFHTAMYAMHKRLEEKELRKFELYGAKGGVSGLNKGDLISIDYHDIDDNRAGSMILTDRDYLDIDRVRQVIKNNNINAIIMMGGDNHLGEAVKGFNADLPFIGWPKTMDGDNSSLITMGYETAVVNAVNFTKAHYNTAITSERVFYVVTFGRDTDWISCGVSAYADVLAIPAEQNYGWDFIRERIKEGVEKNKEKYAVAFSVVHVSEGANIDQIKDPPKYLQKRDKHGEIKLQPKWLALQLEVLSERSGFKPASQVYEYILRDLPPTETDKRLARMAGRECIDAILEGDFGTCPSFELDGDFYRVVRMPLKDIAKKSFVKDKDFFDYEILRTKPSFLEIYGNLFRNSLGEPPTRDQLVYKNMVRN